MFRRKVVRAPSVEASDIRDQIIRICSHLQDILFLLIALKTQKVARHLGPFKNVVTCQHYHWSVTVKPRRLALP